MTRITTGGRAILAALFGIGLAASGCTHQLHITNGDEFFSPPTPPLAQPLTVGVVSQSAAHPQNSRYVDAIVTALRNTGSFDKVLYPYDPSTHGDMINVLVDVNVEPKYSGRGSNFWVNWPGFLIFAPAIWGYGYQAEINTQISVTRRPEGGSQAIQAHPLYRFRQAELDRTWTEIGWLEVGIIPFFGGFAFMQYDPDVTARFISEVSPNYGAFVASKIVAVL
jgi:hypothetical protein